MTIMVSSTTDTQEQVQQAANYGLKTAQASARPQPEVETVEHPEADEAVTGAESETAHTRESEEPEEEEEGPDEEPGEEEEEEQPARPVGKTRKKLLRRLSRLHGENLTLQEKLEEAEQRIRRYEGAGGEKGEKPAAETAPMGKPNPRDYKDYEQYVEALADWKIAQRDQQKAQEAYNEYAQQVVEEYNQQVSDARETHDDFDQVVGQSAQVPIIAINAMYELDNGAEVAYYLGKHPEVRAELLEWNTPGTKGGVRKIFAAIDRISEQLSNHSSSARSNSNGDTAPARQQPRTSAPAPIKPVGGSSSSRSTVDPGSMSYQDYKRWYAKKYGTRR